MNTGLAALIASTEALIKDVLDRVEDLLDERAEIEAEFTYGALDARDRRAAYARLGQIGRQLKAEEDALLALYGTLSFQQQEQAELIRLGSVRLAFA